MGCRHEVVEELVLGQVEGAERDMRISRSGDMRVSGLLSGIGLGCGRPAWTVGSMVDQVHAVCSKNSCGGVQ